MTKNWYPIIDHDICTGCLTCVDFCPHEVYGIEDGKPVVEHPEHCVEFCEGCSKICPTGSINYFGQTS